jgi:hypothetical protein
MVLSDERTGLSFPIAAGFAGAVIFTAVKINNAETNSVA